MCVEELTERGRMGGAFDDESKGETASPTVGAWDCVGFSCWSDGGRSDYGSRGEGSCLVRGDNSQSTRCGRGQQYWRGGRLLYRGCFCY